jgi:hypothetical protein
MPMVLVVRSCNKSITYQIDGPQVTFLGYGDGFHDQRYNVYERKGAFTPYESSTGCDFLIHIYPTQQFEAAYRSNDPVIKTVAIVGCFVITAVFSFCITLPWSIGKLN